MSLLSVIIINFNTFNLTCSCIGSIKLHTTGIDFEIILVDNASTECDPALFLERFPDIKLVTSNFNLGFSRGNNLGIKHSNGDVILLLNSDTELITDSLSHCYHYLKTVGYPIVLTCKLIYPDGRIQFQCTRFPNIYSTLIGLFKLHKVIGREKRSDLFLGNYFNHEERIEPDAIWGTFFMFQKAELLKLPGEKLDDQFFMYVEDLKWCYDFKKAGVRIVYLPDTKVIHHQGSSSNSDFRMDQNTKNEFLFVRQTKGRLYQFFYSLARAANFLIFFNKLGLRLAVNAFKNINC